MYINIATDKKVALYLIHIIKAEPKLVKTSGS